MCDFFLRSLLCYFFKALTSNFVYRCHDIIEFLVGWKFVVFCLKTIKNTKIYHRFLLESGFLLGRIRIYLSKVGSDYSGWLDPVFFLSRFMSGFSGGSYSYIFIEGWIQIRLFSSWSDQEPVLMRVRFGSGFT